jgi:PAS domain S-box-containing protein
MPFRRGVLVGLACFHGAIIALGGVVLARRDDAWYLPGGLLAIGVLAVLACAGSVIAWRLHERAPAESTRILRATGEGIVSLDAAGRVAFVNPAAAAMLGVDAAKAVGKRVGEIVYPLTTAGTPLADQESPILAPLRDRHTRHATDQIFGRMDGSYIPVDYVSAPVLERGELTGLVLSFNDITVRHRSEEALQRSHRQLEHTLAQLQVAQRRALQEVRLRAMGEMASGLAHDFNNSLSPIVGFAELLLRYPDLPRDTAQGYLQLISTAAQEAASVIRRLRELHRERGERAPEEPVDLRRCLDEEIALARPGWTTPARAPGTEIRIDADVKDVPVLRGDALGLREMLAALLANAADAMPQGGVITVRVRAEGGDVRLDVQDTGCGMSEETRQRCFEPFFSTKGRRGGGLGLALAHATVARHGGTLQVESELGRGSTFSVRIPVPHKNS